MRLGITGASGFLAQHIIRQASGKGIETQALSLIRSADKLHQRSLVHFLSEYKLDALVHTAAVRCPKTTSEFHFNSRIPRMLFDAFREINRGGIFVHISSINVVLRSRNDLYSKSKREAETTLADCDAWVIRPSLIWSWENKGDARVLADYFRKPLPVYPMIYPSHYCQPVLVTELAKHIIAHLKPVHRTEYINVLGDQSFTIWHLAKIMAKENNRRLLAVPTGFLESMLPKFLLDRVPVSIRSTNSTEFDYSLGNKPDETWTLPFNI